MVPCAPWPIEIIAMTEHDARELAVTAVGLGATDFYYKPIDPTVLSIVVRRAFRIRELEDQKKLATRDITAKMKQERADWTRKAKALRSGVPGRRLPAGTVTAVVPLPLMS